MIEKSRLEELIKEGATIYTILKGTFIDEIRDLAKVIPYKLNKSFYIEEADGEEILMINFFDENRNIQPALIGYLQNLFETEKDAEWALQYQLIPRTEWLNLPTFEDFGKHPYLSFHDEIPDLYELKIDKNANIVLTLYRGGIYDCGVIEFSKEFTEENYTEVCDLCVKIFKGE